MLNQESPCKNGERNLKRSATFSFLFIICKALMFIVCPYCSQGYIIHTRCLSFSTYTYLPKCLVSGHIMAFLGKFGNFCTLYLFYHQSTTILLFYGYFSQEMAVFLSSLAAKGQHQERDAVTTICDWEVIIALNKNMITLKSVSNLFLTSHYEIRVSWLQLPLN